eukprot:gb/GECG01001859.1/.p1 GENE.gb/GECG01001859.1/~~gb/GECG01001859.1/.p1  ORF type:complete len:130 (+),score=22.28 gb/GECG01001859.1/:1-390(+)
MDDNKPSSSSGGAGGGENEAHTEYIYSLQQQHARGGSYVTREEALQSFPDLKQFQKMEENLETCWKKAVDFWKSQDTETDTSFTQSIEALAEQWGKSSKSLKVRLCAIHPLPRSGIGSCLKKPLQRRKP